jgi:hypothetical protein
MSAYSDAMNRNLDVTIEKKLFSRMVSDNVCMWSKTLAPLSLKEQL